MSINIANFVPTVLCLYRNDPQQIKELMEMALNEYLSGLFV